MLSKSFKKTHTLEKRKEDNEEVIKITKCISIIDLFGKNISLFPSKEILSYALDLSQNKLSNILKDLESKKIIVFRKFKDAYALFSGSDIDLDEVTELNKSKIKDDYDIILSQLPQLQPIVAKKHFHETGTQRIFQRFCLVLTNVKKTVEEIVRLDLSSASAGAFIFLCRTKEDSEKDFEETMDLINLIEFDTVYSFKYSVRPGTPGEKMEYHVPDDKASKRLSILQERQKEITFKKNCDNIGTIKEVLIEGYSKQNKNDLYGRTTHNKVVNIKNLDDYNIGKLINVKITEATQNSLIGEQT